jgi:hypothetical protein
MLENEFTIRLRAMSDNELIDAFNKDVGNPGWVAARGRFHAALREEFIKRGFDFSAIGNDISISFNNKIVLKEKIIQIVEESTQNEE